MAIFRALPGLIAMVQNLLAFISIYFGQPARFLESNVFAKNT